MSEQVLPGKSLPYRVQQLKALASSQSVRNSLILFGGNIFNSGLTLLAMVFISRQLGPSNFGVLATFMALITILLGLTDFGLGAASIKLISSRLSSDPHRADVLMKVIFKAELAAGLIVGLAGISLAPFIGHLLGGEHLVNPIRLAFLAGAFTSAAAFITPFLVSHRKFLKSALVAVTAPALRTAAVVTMVMTATLTLNRVLIAFTIAPAILLILGILVIPPGWRSQAKSGEQSEALKEVFHFSKWVLLSYLAAAVISRLDVFLISGIKGSLEVGYYGASLQLVAVIPQLLSAINNSLLPQVSSYKERWQYVSYLKKLGVAVGVAIICFIPLFFLAGPIINLIFGNRFLQALPSFQYLLAGYFFALLASPISLILYATNRPRVITLLNYVQLAASVILNLILIPKLGAEGAAITFLVINVFGLLSTGYYALRVIKSLPEKMEAV